MNDLCPEHSLRSWLRLIPMYLTIMATIVSIIGAGTLFAQDRKQPAIRMQAVPSRVYQGESFQLQIHMDNFDTYNVPDMAYLNKEFDVKYQGEQKRNSTMITVINNTPKRVEEKGITYTYRLTPKQTGKIRIEPPQVRRGSAVATAFPVEIEVIPPGNQDNVRIEMTSSAQNVYPLMPFEITLTVLVHELPGKYAKYDPVAAISQEAGPSNLFIPWLEDDQLVRGLTPREKWQNWITQYQSRQGGFSVNNVQVDSPFDLSWSLFEGRRNSALFLPEGKVVELKTKDGKTSRFWKYEFTRSFHAEKPGEYKFDAAVIKGIFAKENSEGNLITDEVYTLSQPLTVTVRDVPEEGRPNDYIGAFGKFDWSATLVPDKVHLGEAMTLTLTLSGKGALMNIKQPNLETIPGIADRFKLYPPTEEIKEGTARFTWSLRPTQAGSIEFPSVPISYFDVEKQQFVAAKTAPITITVDQSQTLASESSTVTATGTIKKKTDLKRANGGIFANMTNPNGAMDQRVTLSQWGTTVGAMTGFGLLAWATLLILRNDRVSSWQNRRRVETAARDSVQTGLEQLDQDKNTVAAAAEIGTGFLSLIDDCFHKPVSTVTESEIRNVLNRLIQLSNTTGTNDSERSLLTKIRDLFACLEEVRYGMDASTLARLKTDVPGLFDQWEHFVAVRKNRRRIRTVVDQLHSTTGKGDSTFGGSATGLSILLLLSLAVSGTIGCHSSNNQAGTEEFQQALKLFDEADQLAATQPDKSLASPEKESQNIEKSRELFRKSAAIYQGMLDRGIESGPILYNQGNAWMRAGDEARALAAWYKAKQYLPTNPYLNANIETLAPRFEGEKGRPLPELVFFWQNVFSYPVKYKFSIVLAAGILLGVLVLLFVPFSETSEKRSPRRFVTRTVIGLTALFIVISLSALYDWNRFDVQKGIVVANPEVIARKGNSSQYQPAFAQPLPKLTRGVLLEESNEWLRVRFPNGQDGWIPASDAVLF